MFSSDYNGWADVPEEEREALEVFEAGTWLHRAFSPPPATPLLPPVIPVRPFHRRAA